MTLPPSLSRLVQSLEQAITTNGRLTPLKTKELVLAADVQVDDMMHYADFDHPIEDCYGRKMVHDAGNFEVMVMSWKPGDYSSIHNHGYTEWGVVQVFGNTHHMIFNVKDQQLSFAKKEVLSKGSAIQVANAFIHQMGNATTAPYLTLHVYGSNSLSGNITADAKNYDLELDRVAQTCGGAFFNLPDTAVHAEHPGVQPSQDVFLHYAYLLLDYYRRQVQTDEIIGKQQHVMARIEAALFETAEVA